MIEMNHPELPESPSIEVDERAVPQYEAAGWRTAMKNLADAVGRAADTAQKLADALTSGADDPAAVVEVPPADPSSPPVQQ